MSASHKAPDLQSILSARLRRQFLAAPVADHTGYVDAFRMLQPVSPVFFSRPGDPPTLTHRTQFADRTLAERLRANRTIVKGRFLGGGIGYVLADDLDVYANAFCKPLERPTAVQEEVLEAVCGAGPLTPRQIKEETGLLNKQIGPALHRLQQAFLVYEDQVDTDWDRAWYDFAAEWPDVRIEDARVEQSAATVLERFFSAHVFATFEQVKDWSRLPAKVLKRVVEKLENAGPLRPAEIDGLGAGWIHADAQVSDGKPDASVFMLHKADYLVRSHVSELKRRYGKEETLQYLLIDGTFQGAVLGHWRIGPHDVDDIVLDIPKRERTRRKKEILAAVSEVYRPPHSHIQRYDGKAL